MPSPSRKIPFDAARPLAAFTLLEIILVVAIIGILATLGLTLAPNMMDRSRKDRAIGDMAVIQQALEAYRARFGDYPRYPTIIPAAVGSDEAGYLLNALNGRYGPAGDVIDVNPMLNNALLEFENSGLPLVVPMDNRILDPWGQPYVYDDEPENESEQELFGYFLYSYGPDEAEGGGDDIYAR